MDLSALTSFGSSLLAVCLVLLLPGAVWLLWMRGREWDVLESLAEAAASSLSLMALVGMLLGIAGIRVSAFAVLSLAGGLLLLWFLLRQAHKRAARLRAADLFLLAGLLVLVGWRFYQVRSLVLPAWVDSVHHTLLVRLILERGGVPADWQPYLDVTMFYHYGFHISAALFSFFSRLDEARAVLVFSQVLNAFTAAAAYRLGKALWGNTSRAAAAGLLVGFAFHMPAYYASWGRSTLLTGLVVLALALAAALDVWKNPSDRPALARLVLYAAGVCFCHFLAVGLLMLFLLVLAGFELARAWRERQWRSVVWQPQAAAALGALSALPWLWRVWSNSAIYFNVNIISPFDASQADAVASYLNYLGFLIGPRSGYVLLGLAGLGLLLALRHSASRPLALWGLLMAVLATPWGPRFNPFRPDHLAIVLFLPASLLCADVLVSAGEALARWKGRLAGAAGCALALGGLLLWGMLDGRNVLNPSTNFTTQADGAALRWIDQSTPADARFYINVTPWQGTMFRGVDGGYWIAPATGRKTVLPPAAYGWGKTEEIDRQTALYQRISQVKGCTQEFWDVVEQQSLTHVYVREFAGSLQPGALESCQGLELVYQQGGVYIYAVNLQD